MYISKTVLRVLNKNAVRYTTNTITSYHLTRRTTKTKRSTKGCLPHSNIDSINLVDLEGVIIEIVNIKTVKNVIKRVNLPTFDTVEDQIKTMTRSDEVITTHYIQHGYLVIIMNNGEMRKQLYLVK